MSYQSLSKVWLTCLLMPTLLYALPAIEQVQKTTDDATVTLKIYPKAIKGDAKSPCEINIDILGMARAFSAGDQLKIELLESDAGFGDDLLWSKTEMVSAAEVTAQRVTKTYDCSSDFGADDAFGGLDIYAKLSVTKDACGTFCLDDTPATSNISVELIEDDGNEEDDMLSDAKAVDAQATDRIAKDADFFKFTLRNPATLKVTSEILKNGGPLEINLLQGGQVIASGNDTATGQEISIVDALNAGDYQLQVMPTEMNNFNFYTLTVEEEAVNVDCSAGTIEEKACGNCGKDKRTCNNMGKWEAWSGCQNQGACQPGAKDTKSCGEDGLQTRECTNQCQWGPLSACVQCNAGQTESCYDGPPEKNNIGICKPGQRACNNGVWGMCENDVWPESAENCTDGLDNDCDGLNDLQDSDCIGGIGASCLQNTECGFGLTCLTNGFPDGLCGRTGCENCQVGEVCSLYQGQAYCLKPCTSIMDCRSGYLCVANDQNVSACLPACLSDMNCAMGYTCVNTQCVPSMSNQPNLGGTMNPPTTVPPVTNPSVQKSDGCDQNQQSGMWIWVMLMLMGHLGLKRINRRSFQ